MYRAEEAGQKSELCVNQLRCPCQRPSFNVLPAAPNATHGVNWRLAGGYSDAKESAALEETHGRTREQRVKDRCGLEAQGDGEVGRAHEPHRAQQRDGTVDELWEG
jgi:hypothetical protein